MNDPHLAFEKIKYLAIRDKILAGNPDIDDQTLADTVEGLSELPDKLAAIIRDALYAEALATGVKLLMSQMAERLERFERRAERDRAIARDVMGQAALTKLQMPDFTASIGQGRPHVIVIDEALIPETFWKTERTLRKGDLGKALKDGAQIDGAALSNAEPVLTVRTR